MIHLVLDTNIYHNNHTLKTYDFTVLSRMAESECLSLHVPYIVEREFGSFLEQKQRKNVNEVISGLKNILKFEIPSNYARKLNKILEIMEQNIDDFSTESSKAFVKWLNLKNAVRHSITQELAQHALEAYFNGDPPLKQPKVRNDIPDSFVFQQVLQLGKTYKSQLVVVTSDKALLAACQQASILCHEDLRSFFQSSPAKKCLFQVEYERREHAIMEFVNNLANSNIEKIALLLENTLLTDDYRTLSGDYIPGENNEIFVGGVNLPYDVKIFEIAYAGGEEFLVYVSARVELMYEYPMFIYDAVELDPSKYHTSPLNKHYVDVETTDIFEFGASIVLDLSEFNILQILDTGENSLSQIPTMFVNEISDIRLL